jgi:RNA polymerase sigma-70 factor (ECF subfamily)
MAADTFMMAPPDSNPRKGLSDSLLHSELARLREHLERDHRAFRGASGSAGDVAQDAAARVLERKDELEFGSRHELRAYLWLTAKRLLVDRWRRRARKESLEELESLASGLPAGPPIEIPDGRTEDLFKSLQQLTFQDRRVLELAYLHDATVGEIASELGISVPAVKMRLSRARERLRERLGLG